MTGEITVGITGLCTTLAKGHPVAHTDIIRGLEIPLFTIDAVKKYAQEKHYSIEDRNTTKCIYTQAAFRAADFERGDTSTQTIAMCQACAVIDVLRQIKKIKKYTKFCTEVVVHMMVVKSHLGMDHIKEP